MGRRGAREERVPARTRTRGRLRRAEKCVAYRGMGGAVRSSRCTHCEAGKQVGKAKGGVIKALDACEAQLSRTWSTALTSALLSISSRRTSLRPLPAAFMRTVLPSWQGARGDGGGGPSDGRVYIYRYPGQACTRGRQGGSGGLEYLAFGLVGAERRHETIGLLGILARVRAACLRPAPGAPAAPPLQSMALAALRFPFTIFEHPTTQPPSHEGDQAGMPTPP